VLAGWKGALNWETRSRKTCRLFRQQARKRERTRKHFIASASAFYRFYKIVPIEVTPVFKNKLIFNVALKSSLKGLLKIPCRIIKH